MKISREQVQLNREAIVSSAARLFRKQGISATGVAEVTHDAGLTHGGFYAQFPQGKEGLVVEAIQRAFQERRQIWNDLAENRTPAEALKAIVGSYISELHLTSLGDGCPVPLLATDASRMTAPVRAAFTEGVRSYLTILERQVPGNSEAERQAAAAYQLAAIAGAMLLARALDDSRLARTFLDAVDPEATAGE